MNICDKFSCNHYKKIFDFKNKFHDHIRNKEYQQFFIKSKSVNKIDLTSLFIFETISNDANIVIRKRKIKFNIRNHKYQKLFFNKSDIVIKIVSIKFFIFEKNVIFVVKNISSHKFNLLTFAFVETLTLLSTYRFVLFSSLIYKFYKKLYFIIVNLYMRYISLSKFRYIINLIIILFIFIIQNLYEKFHNKKKRIIFILNKILNSSIKQYTTR